MRRSAVRAVLAGTLCAAGAALPPASSAQLISPKTIPVAEGDQFLVHPSLRLGMGGVSIALDDPLADPFVNPARGAALEHTILFAAPTYYNVTEGDGNGLTLPVGALWTGESWFGGVSVALQEITAPRPSWGWLVLDVWPGQTQRLTDRAAANLYGTASIGRRLGDGRTALGVSGSYASLQAVDGVDLLYATSERIEQDGHTADVRIGLTRALANGGSLEILALHDRFDMTHDVTYVDVHWDTTTWTQTVTRRVQRNPDRTNTWGLHLGYDRPIGGSGWRAGGILSGNYKDHPKIPNYELMNIPRDPGHTWAYNVGGGVALEDGPLTAGLDVVLEPIWSSTWADTPEPITRPDGSTLPAGARTVENEFVFRNALVRAGVGREAERYALQAGLQARSISYRLDQRDNVQRTDRRARESWLEWTPSWGAAVRFPELEVRYAGRITTGTGLPGTESGIPMADIRLGSSFLPAPNGPLTLSERDVVTHRVTVAIPVR